MDNMYMKDKPNNSWRPEGDVLKQLQRSFCRANNLYCRCMAGDMTPLTPAYGSGDEQKYLIDLFGGITSAALGASLDLDSLESVIETETGKDYLKHVVILVRQGKRTLCYWIVQALIKEKLPSDMEVPNYMLVTTEEAFYASIELLEVISKEYFEVRKQEFSALETVKSDITRMGELQKELKLHMAMNHILKNNETDDTFVDVASEIMKEAAEYLNVPFIALLQKIRGTDIVTELAHYWKNGINPIKTLPDSFHISQSPFFTGKTYIFSSDAILPESFEQFFKDFEISAAMFLPIEVSGSANLYVSVLVPRTNRIFSISDIKFANDMKKVLQNILERKVKQNSLAGSFNALEAVINSLNLAVHVSDPTTHKVLFTNKAYGDLGLEPDVTYGGLEEYLASDNMDHASGKYEYYESSTNRWYETTHSKIIWVDGRGAILTTILEITDKKTYVQKMEHRANNDFITGLYNRMRFEQDLRGYIKTAEEMNTNGAVIYLDLDDYRALKNGIGRQNGDDLLREVSKSLEKITGLEGFCYAMGTEQFSIIINHRNYPVLSDILLKIKKLFDEPWFIKGKQYHCYMNMGIAVYPSDGRTVEELMKKADVALFEAKRHGRNSYEYYIEEMERGEIQRKDMEKNIMSAASDDFSEFNVFFQPIFDGEGEVVGAEALVRWNSRELGFVTPDDFIPMLEYMRLMRPIGDMVLRRALGECRKWLESGRPELKVHVNLSVTQLMENDIAERIENALNDSHVKPENLVIEVTESLALNDLDRMKRILLKIRRLGVLVALDDFGEDFFSINYLREMPVNYLKVDRSLINGIATDEFKQSFVKMAKEMSDALGFIVCAEGVENEEEAEAVKNSGIKYSQGYLYEKPLTSAQFIRKYV